MKDICDKRVELLEDNVLKTSLEIINLEDSYNIYDILLSKVFNGELDDIFLTDKLNGLSEEEKKKVLELSRKYAFLCFYKGEFENWADSPAGVSKGPRLTCVKLLDDYDYLIDLARYGKEELMEFLAKFKNTGIYKKAPIISYLRTNFSDDETLKDIIIEMSKKDGGYSNFTDSQKFILCEYAEGLLYRLDDNKVTLISPKDVEKSIIGEDETDIFIKSVLESIDDSTFKEKIEEIYVDYREEYNYKK